MKKISFLRRMAAMAGLSLASGGAMASAQCDSVLSYLSTITDQSYYSSTLASYREYYPACFASDSTALSAQGISSTSFVQLFLISQNVGLRLLSGGGPTRTTQAGSGTGMAAGSSPGAWNVWANYSGDTSNYRVDSLYVPGVVLPFNIDNLNQSENVVLGGDYRIAPAMVLGLSAAFDQARGYVNPAAPNQAARTYTANRGMSLAGYFGWQLDKNWAVDATIGAGTGVSNPAPGSTADSTRLFAGANLTYARWIGNWQFSGKAGYQFGSEKFENIKRGAVLPLTYYTARLGQVRAGGEVGYWLANGVMPYVGIAYVNDVSLNRVRVPQLWDEDGFTLTAGINFFSLKNNLSGGIVYTDDFDRKFVRHSNWMANINYRF